MRLVGIYMGSVFALLLGGGAFVFSDPVDHQETYDEAILCEARGGAWVHEAGVPLCMTPEDGLLEFVDGSFVAYISQDPWEQPYASPLKGKELQALHAQDAEERGTQEAASHEASLWDEDQDVMYQEKEYEGGCKEEEVEEYKGKIVEVDFSSWPEAEKYRTAIRRDVKRGVNFAGEYIVSTWGCGRRKRDACVGHAIVSARTGKIVLYGIQGRRAADFSPDTNIFSVQLQDGEEKMWSVQGSELVECRDISLGEGESSR